MADVEMTDAPTAGGSQVKKATSGKARAGGEEKKRFEVKKVSEPTSTSLDSLC